MRLIMPLRIVIIIAAAKEGPQKSERRVWLGMEGLTWNMEHQTSNICYSFISEDEFRIRRDCGLPPGICCSKLECLQTGQSRFAEAAGRHPTAPGPDGTSPEKYLEQDRRHPQGDEPSH